MCVCVRDVDESKVRELKLDESTDDYYINININITIHQTNSFVSGPLVSMAASMSIFCVSRLNLA